MCAPSAGGTRVWSNLETHLSPERKHLCRGYFRRLFSESLRLPSSLREGGRAGQRGPKLVREGRGPGRVDGGPTQEVLGAPDPLAQVGRGCKAS